MGNKNIDSCWLSGTIYISVLENIQGKYWKCPDTLKNMEKKTILFLVEVQKIWDDVT